MAAPMPVGKNSDQDQNKREEEELDGFWQREKQRN